MSKKRISLLALVLAVMMLLCACAKEQPEKDSNIDKDPTKAPTTQTDPTDPSEPGQLDPTDPKEDDDPEPPEDDPVEEPYMDSAKAIYGSSASGYGIWTSSYGFNTAKRLCIDTRGFIAFEMDKSETDVAGVYNNAVLMKVNYDYYILRSVPEGQMLFDSSNSDGAKIILPEHNGKDMFRDGYMMVMKAVESYNGVTLELGFINAKGEWIQPLSSENPILSRFDKGLTIAALEREVSYLGEGIIGMLCADKVYRYYDINANTLTGVTFPNNISNYTMYDALDYDVRFVEGVSDPVYMNNNYYLFYKNGKVEQFNVLWPNGLPRATRCGNPYFDRGSKTAYFLYTYDEGILVADSNGKIIKKHEGVDLEEYQYLTAARSACRGFATDGYARIIMKNTEGTAYYTVLGINGQFLFEPVRLNDNVNTVFDLEGYNIDVKSTAGYGYFVVIDNDGAVRYESDYVNDFSVRNGIVYFDDDGEESYIDVRP